MAWQNKNKSDYNRRFLNQNFKKRLSAQRNYKRTTRDLPQTDWGVFLSKIGLGSWLSRAITLLVFFFLVYLVFIPNLFFVHHISINGASGADLVSIQSVVNSFLEKKLPLPQKNLLLLSKGKLTDFLLKNSQKVLKVNKINKKLPSTLVLDISPRLDQFSIQTRTYQYSVSNDGLVTGQIFQTASTTLPSGLVLIKLSSDESLIVGHSALSGGDISFINQVQNQAPAMVKSPVEHYELAALGTPDLWVYTQSGVKLIFDLKSDAAPTLNRLRLLFSQLSEADAKKLYYIDMRFENKSYICYKGSACTKNINLPNNPINTAPAGIPN